MSFWRHRRELNNLLSSANQQNLTSYRYFRLLIFSLVDITLALPLNVAILALNVLPMFWVPWKGLGDLHEGFSFVGQFTVSEWASTSLLASLALILPCTAIGSSFIFFIFFGLGREARSHYQKFSSTIGRLWKSRRTIRRSGSAPDR